MKRRISASAAAVIAIVTASGCMHVTVTTSGPQLGMSARATRTDAVDLNLKTGERLTLRISDGPISIRAGQDAQPTLKAKLTLHARDEEEANQLLEEFRFDCVRTADGLRVELAGDPQPIHVLGREIHVRPRAECEVTVPHGARLEIETSSGGIAAVGPFGATTLASSYGNIELSDVCGDVRVRSSSGSIELSKVKDAGQVDVESSYGRLEMRSVQAKRLAANTSSGGIEIEDAQGQDISIETSHGRLTISDVSGNVNARTSSGDVTLNSADKGAYKLSSGFGDVRVRGAKGALTLRSSSGDITVEDADGAVDAQTDFGSVQLAGVLPAVRARSSSGGIRVEAQTGSAPTDPWSIHSDYGKADVSLPAGANCVVQARTGYGSVNIDSAMNVSRLSSSGRQSLSFTLGTGGPTISVSSSSGNIHISQRGEQTR